MIKELICLLFSPWLIICRLFNLGKFNKWETNYPCIGDELYQVEPWHTCGCGNQSNCSRKWCPYDCIFINY